MKSFRIYSLAAYICRHLCISPIRRSGSRREINEAERLARMRGSHQSRLLEISSYFFFFGYLYGDSRNIYFGSGNLKSDRIYKLIIF